MSYLARVLASARPASRPTPLPEFSPQQVLSPKARAPTADPADRDSSWPPRDGAQTPKASPPPPVPDPMRLPRAPTPRADDPRPSQIPERERLEPGSNQANEPEPSRRAPVDTPERVHDDRIVPAPSAAHAAQARLTRRDAENTPSVTPASPEPARRPESPSLDISRSDAPDDRHHRPKDEREPPGVEVPPPLPALTTPADGVDEPSRRPAPTLAHAPPEAKPDQLTAPIATRDPIGEASMFRAAFANAPAIEPTVTEDLQLSIGAIEVHVIAPAPPRQDSHSPARRRRPIVAPDAGTHLMLERHSIRL
jgi:hypothetical protein